MCLNLEKLRTTLLVKEKEVDKILEPIKSAWPLFDVGIVFYGWIDTSHYTLINVDVLVTSECIHLYILYCISMFLSRESFVFHYIPMFISGESLI